MPVTKLYTFNLTCVILLVALYGVAFSLGDKWNEIKKLYGFTNEEMFQIFNTKAIDYAVETGKTIRFTQDPRLYIGSSLYDEWVYLQTQYDYYDLLLDEGYYYAIK